jgi:hypothetical protein
MIEKVCLTFNLLSFLADMAFTLFNGAHFNNGMRLSLSISPVDQACEPEPMSDILQVQHLPMDSSNQSIYDLFRPFGPMALCKIIVEQGPTAVFNGTALIQYYHTEDADHAISVMVRVFKMGRRESCAHLTHFTPYFSLIRTTK